MNWGEVTMHLEEGTQVGRHRIATRLGGGGMGEVYLARDTQLRRPVALKIPSPEQVDEAGGPDRFLREARAAALNHPSAEPFSS